MKGILLLVLVVFFAGFVAGKQYYQPQQPALTTGFAVSTEQEAYLAPVASGPNGDSQKPQFRCDGRRYCSEMTSRAEANFFLQHCPDTAMDGDQDGIPCEFSPRWNTHFAESDAAVQSHTDDEVSRSSRKRY